MLMFKKTCGHCLTLIYNLPETPYFQPPPIHIWDLKMRDRVRVITWDLQDGVAKPLITKQKTKKKNKVAAISDGEMVIKIALFEEFSSKVLEGDMSSEAQIPLT